MHFSMALEIFIKTKVAQFVLPIDLVFSAWDLCACAADCCFSLTQIKRLHFCHSTDNGLDMEECDFHVHGPLCM